MDRIEPSADSPLNVALLERERATLSMVRRAILNRDVLLAFQPVVQSANPDRPSFYEGLIRILDDTGRIIPAGSFIESVEATELGRVIDCLSLEMGMIALERDPALRLSINMSARSIGYPNWMKTLKRGLALDDTSGERLILEITETSAMGAPDTVLAFMRELQMEGVTFALDDFGAGYTSFRYLREFYFDLVKIDGQFIRGIHSNPDNQVLAEALLSIARHFDMFTVAESIESAQDAAYIAAMGIDCMQGYYFGAPSIMPPGTITDARLNVKSA